MSKKWVALLSNGTTIDNIAANTKALAKGIAEVQLAIHIMQEVQIWDVVSKKEESMYEYDSSNETWNEKKETKK